MQLKRSNKKKIIQHHLDINIHILHFFELVLAGVFDIIYVYKIIHKKSEESTKIRKMFKFRKLSFFSEDLTTLFMLDNQLYLFVQYRKIFLFKFVLEEKRISFNLNFLLGADLVLFDFNKNIFFSSRSNRNSIELILFDFNRNIFFSSRRDRNSVDLVLFYLNRRNCFFLWSLVIDSNH